METYVKIKACRESHDIRDVKAITIAELIEDLKSFPMDAKIVISFDLGYTYGSISYDNMYQCLVETFDEQVAREKAEEETCVCPHCESDNIYVSVNGAWVCLECNARFKKAKIKSI